MSLVENSFVLLNGLKKNLKLKKNMNHYCDDGEGHNNIFVV